jgi:hypothetical protein
MQRWAPLKSIRAFLDKEVEEKGCCTDLPLAQEFCCFVGVLYGRSRHEHEVKELGTPNAADLALRCAYQVSQRSRPISWKVGSKRGSRLWPLAFAVAMNRLRTVKSERRGAAMGRGRVLTDSTTPP